MSTWQGCAFLFCSRYSYHCPLTMKYAFTFRSFASQGSIRKQTDLTKSNANTV